MFQTKDRETALHCASQYGHTAVVSQLLEHACDPTIRNTRQETALDLAAQYGRYVSPPSSSSRRARLVLVANAITVYCTSGNPSPHLGPRPYIPRPLNFFAFVL